MFFLAEYINMINVSAVAITLFLGGWRAPAPISTVWPGANEGWWPLLWFFGKVYLFMFVFVWLRGTLPRLRYDQFMKFGWKVLIPSSIVWILAVGAMRAARSEYGLDTRQLLLWVGGALVLVAAVMFFLDVVRGPGEEPEEPAPEYDPMAGGFPVPPLPGQEPDRSRRVRTPVRVTAGDVEPTADEDGQEAPRG